MSAPKRLSLIVAAALALSFASVLPSVAQSDEAEAQNNQAKELYEAGKYVEAIVLAEQVLATREKALGPDHPSIAIWSNNLALLYKAQGRHAEAESLYRRALAIDEKNYGPDHPDVAICLNNLAELLRETNRLTEAEPLIRRELDIFEKSYGPDHPYVASALNNLALLLRQTNRRAEAEPLIRRALTIAEKIYGPDHPYVADTLNNLAGLLADTNRLSEAEPLYRRALKIEQSRGPDHLGVATIFNNLALLLRRTNRLSEAELLMRRALAIREKALGPDHFHVATCLNNLAGLLGETNRLAEAEPLYRRALTITEKIYGPDHPYVASALNNLAELLRQTNRLAEALPIMRRLILEHHARKWVALSVLLRSRGERLIDPAYALVGSYEVVQRASLSAAGKAIAKLAARFASPDNELGHRVRDDQDLAREAEWRQKTLDLAFGKPSTERNIANEEALRRRIDAIKVERENIQRELDLHFPDYVALSRPQPLSLKETQALLADDEALVVFDFDARSYAWIITRATADWTELKVNAQGLDAQVRTLRVSFKAEGIPFNVALAHKIYQATFGAFAEKILSKTRLSVVTNGAITSLPLHLLVTKEPSGKQLKDIDWLVRSHAITIWPSVANMKVLRGKSVMSSPPKRLIAFADPVFSKQKRSQARQRVGVRSITEFYRGTQVDVPSLAEALVQLPGTRQEVQAVAKALNASASDIKLGLAATETAVKQAKLDQYQIVYFATHGLVAGFIERFAKAKAEPALALTIPDKPSDLDDGLLSASEVAQLKLNADWVVLSACNTAAAETPGAEALSGLARAFFYAGARSLVVSHWEVNDEHTARLMTKTFEAKARTVKLTHSQALQQSMLAFLRNAKSNAEAHPRHWAAFVVVGEPAIK